MRHCTAFPESDSAAAVAAITAAVARHARGAGTLAVACGVLALAPLAAGQQFLWDITKLPPHAGPYNEGVELVDVDADGDVDMVFAVGVYVGVGTEGAMPQRLWLNDGNGTFTVADAQLHVAAFNAKMVVADDLDGDGDPDLAYASGSTGSPPRVLLNDGTGNFTDVTATNVPPLALRSLSIATGDVDGDGDLDLAVNDGGTFTGILSQAHLLLNDGHAAFTDVTAAQMPVHLHLCRDLTFFDFDLDGDVDLALAGKASSNKYSVLYRNDGSGTFSVSTGTLQTVGGSFCNEVEWADLDGDGDFDGAVDSANDALNCWARNDGLSPMAIQSLPDPDASNVDFEAACLDIDDDGDLDVIVAGSFKEKTYRNLGGAFEFTTGIFDGKPDITEDFGVADLDGDGDHDIVTAQTETPSNINRVFVNSGPADTHAPRLMKSYLPAGFAHPETVVKLQLADDIADDGHIRCTLSYTATLLPSGVASGAATPMGNGLFRVAVPTPAGTTEVSISCTATDSVGNVLVLDPIVLHASAWTDLGSALAGTGGAPLLAGTGSLVAGEPMSLALSNVPPLAPAALFLAFTSSPTPFKGGTLLPVPPLFALGLATDPVGQLVIAFPAWPGGASGLSLFFQYAVANSGAPKGVALSNALRADIP